MQEQERATRKQNDDAINIGYGLMQNIVQKQRSRTSLARKTCETLLHKPTLTPERHRLLETRGSRDKTTYRRRLTCFFFRWRDGQSAARWLLRYDHTYRSAEIAALLAQILMIPSTDGADHCPFRGTMAKRYSRGVTPVSSRKTLQK